MPRTRCTAQEFLSKKVVQSPGSLPGTAGKFRNVLVEALGGQLQPLNSGQIGEDHFAKCMDFGVVDEMAQFTDDDAFGMARELASVEGILAGGSSGANLWGCRWLANRLDKPATIVTVLPDTGLKYLSKIFVRD